MKRVYAVNKLLRNISGVLGSYFGDLGWWPARSRFEVIVGAILTQNTSWKNVEKAIEKLRTENLLTLKSLQDADPGIVERSVRSTGYFRQKTERLKGICEFLRSECGADLRRAGKIDTGVFREKLLSVKGIGPETADSILLYAFDRPVFVVDAYTMRIFQRHGIIDSKTKYQEVQNMVHIALGEDIRAFNQFHAGIVETGKRFCLKKLYRCGECPLKDIEKGSKL